MIVPELRRAYALLIGLTTCGDLDDFDHVTFSDGGGVDLAGEEGDLIVLDDDGFAGEAQAIQKVGYRGGVLEGAGLAVEDEGHLCLGMGSVS
jgi:hypothetical protein